MACIIWPGGDFGRSACGRHNAVVAEIVNRVLPILILLLVGFGMRRIRFITRGTVDDMRKLVVNLALPAVLFTAFLEVELQSSDLVTVVAVFVICVVLFIVGKLFHNRFGSGHDYFPFLMTGFEAGMLGISLFGTAYGLDRVGHFAIVDLGHELFIWFVFLALLLVKRDGIRKPADLLRAFISSPVIIAILTGITGNVLDLADSFAEWPITGGLLNTLGVVAGLTVPLILLIVGYGLHLDLAGIREAVRPVLVRLLVVAPLAVLLPPILMGDILNGGEYAEAALFTLLILPPPFIIPLYMKPGVEDERRYVNNVLSLYTVVSIAVFIVYMTVNPL